MTQQEAGKYAAQCYSAKVLARKTGTPYVKPERPDVNQLDSLENVARTSKKNLRTLSYRMNVITGQMDLLLDFIQELTDENPQYREYLRIADYLNGSLFEIDELLKTL